MANVATQFSRRALLGGGGALIVNFSIGNRLSAQEAAGAGHAPAASALPGSLKTAPLLDAWIRIGADGSITVFTGKSELGQGIKTALIQVAAEQLSVPFGAINLITSDTDRTPDEVYTAGSQSMQDSGTAILHAAAQVREILIATAATRLSMQAGDLKAEDGAIVAPNGRRLHYGELVADAVLHVEAQPAAASKLKDPETFKSMGQALPRIDIPAKVTGGPAYVQDMRLPGMVHARVVRPPSYGAQLRSVETAGVEKMPGVKKVVRDGNFLAVIADGEFRAVKAMEALSSAAHWDERETMPDPATFYAWLKQQPAKTIIIRDVQSSAAERAVRTLEADYLRPHQMHGSIGPSCAVAHFADGRITVFSHGQGMFPLRSAVAQLTKLPPENVHCIHVEGSGCYGHNGADDAAADAAYLAVAYPGVPVRVQWMREQEHRWEPYGPGMAMNAKAQLDAKGSIVAWDYNVWSDTHSTRPGGAGSTLVGQHISASFAPPPPSPGSQPTGFGDRNIIPLYQIPNVRLAYNFVPHQKVRVSALRGLGAYANVFAIESFMDELAKAAAIDPVQFRLRHLADARAQAVIHLAAEKFGWTDRQGKSGRGQGFAFAKYKNLAAYCAIAIELEVQHETGRIRLLRAVSAVDSGQTVNPDGIKNQIEGGIVQSASWTIHEAVAFNRTRIDSRDWSTYPILRFADLFESVDVHVIDRPRQPFLGTGEAAQGPTVAAIANALADATGQRIRELPFSRSRVKSAIGV
jgi:CO/xanthine dehydrogenase Mo-binding subunit